MKSSNNWGGVSRGEAYLCGWKSQLEIISYSVDGEKWSQPIISQCDNQPFQPIHIILTF